MGTENSAAKPFMAEPYIVLDGNADDLVTIKDISTKSLILNTKILHTGFFAIWSMKLSDSIAPPPRTTHFMTYVPSIKTAICGYGIDINDNLLNDIWSLDADALQWKSLRIDTSSVSPRNGTTSCLVDNKIYLYGGFSGVYYIDDLHALDLTNMTILRPQTTNNGPVGRIGHVMSSYKNKIMIWGGYNGDWLSDLWILDTDTMTWRELPCEINGRTSATFTNHGDILYIFGATKTDALLTFNWLTEKMDVVSYSGSAPPPELSAASMVAADRYLLLFGGKLEKRNHCLMYSFDTVRKWWFVFHINPDGETTTVTDGHVDKNGMFLVPRIWSSSIVYRKNRRDSLLFMGSPLFEPPKIGVVDIGDALSVLHLQTDLYETLYYQ